MKIAIIGAAGVRMPLIIQAIAQRQETIELSELALMDIDSQRLELTGVLSAPLEESGTLKFKITRTTDPRIALAGADFVLTTFRVGGMEARVVDERVPLSYGVLGQETTGPGGFALAMRTIPVVLRYLSMMRELCPQAWLINFANPAGLIAEAAIRTAGWERTVGVCDAPAAILRIVAILLGTTRFDVYLDYFGLNHLGWTRSIVYQNRNYLPEFIKQMKQRELPIELPFTFDQISRVGMLPNEYLFYYYSTQQAVHNLQRAGRTRGQQLLSMNNNLFSDLLRFHRKGDRPAMLERYQTYLAERGETYPTTETTGKPFLPETGSLLTEALQSGGYTGVALDVIEGLLGATPRTLVLNVVNRGAITGMDPQDVVEIPALVGRNFVQRMPVGDIPAPSLALMKRVKEFERLTIQAASEGSYDSALKALVSHPLIADENLARLILDDYIFQHGTLFPKLR
ncbi:MAG: hypothetical protein PHQ40_08500 [Anaerolineaceae bacterium]|nr:hypothetical protein [Anaerolineaceae bacterium]